MSAFATALAALHADPNIGAAADYRRPPSSWLPVRIVLSSPSDQLGALGGVAMRAGTTSATLLISDAAGLAPQRGDELRVAGTIYRIEDAELDALGISCRLVLSPTD
jgi:hypothetical protein